MAASSAASPAARPASSSRIRRSAACPMCRVRRSSSRSIASPRTRVFTRLTRSSAPASGSSSTRARAFTRSSRAACPSRSAARRSTARSLPISTRAICSCSWAPRIRAARGSTGPTNRVSGTVGTYDKLLGYDFLLDRFFPVSVTGEYLLGISQTGLTLENLDSISSSLDALTLSLDAYATAVQPEIAQFDGCACARILPRHQSRGDARKRRSRAPTRTASRSAGFRPDHRRRHAVRLGVVSRYAVGSRRRAGAEVLVNARTGRCDVHARHPLFALQGADSGGDVLDLLRRRRARLSTKAARYDGLRSRHHRDRSEEDRARDPAARGRPVERGRHGDACDRCGDDGGHRQELRGRIDAAVDAGDRERRGRESATARMFVSAVANGSFTITHANSATTGRTFLYALLG